MVFVFVMIIWTNQLQKYCWLYFPFGMNAVDGVVGFSHKI
jgi:hypothetical protein